jgi:hypothetical protein
MKPELILTKALEIFPLDNMGRCFKGTHSFTLSGKKLTLNLWYKKKSWPVYLAKNENLRSSKDIVLWLTDIKVEIERRLIS